MYRLRLRYGLRWEKARPSLLNRHVFVALLLILLFAMAGSIDYAVQRAEFAERAAELYASKAKVLDDCERGATGYYYTDGRAYECGKRL
jgi:hypothetical protein